MYDQSTRSAIKKVDETFLTAEKISSNPRPLTSLNLFYKIAPLL